MFGIFKDLITASSITGFILAAAILLLCWRFWRFTLRPILRPNEPREFPYWIPYFGHAISALQSFNHLTETGGKYFGQSREPYGLTLAGTTIYIITSPQDVANVAKTQTTRSLDFLWDNIYKTVDLSEDERKIMLHADPSAKSPNLRQMLIKVHHQELHPGAQFDELFERRILPSLEEAMEMRNMKQSAAVISLENGDSMIISLHKLCTEIFIKGTTDAYFGRAIYDLLPDFNTYYLKWEDEVWKQFLGLPGIFCREMLRVKRRLLNAMIAFFKLPAEARQDQGDFVEELERILGKAGLDEEGMGKIMFLAFWSAIAGNTYKLAFWVVAYLVHDPQLFASIRNEVLAVVKDGLVDEKQLLDGCPMLDSLFSEVLRKTVTAGLSRKLTSPVIMSGKLIREESYITVPIRDLHLNQEIWGPDPFSFEPLRFQMNSKLSKNPSYRPWGVGNTLCPGRFLAKRYIFRFVALLLSQYEVEMHLEDGQKGKHRFPRGDSARPSAGVEDIEHGEDVFLRLRARESGITKDK